jgi:hypothetical protein
MSKENIPIGGEPDCSRHKKEIAGISDMKVLAEMIGDLHYETLAQLLRHLSLKLENDSEKDTAAGRKGLGSRLWSANRDIYEAAININKAWQISKPFMTDKNHPK